jgi:salicylate hydroxylase
MRNAPNLDTISLTSSTVHRHHLHQGLGEVARQSGAELITDARATHIDYATSFQVLVTTESGSNYTFNLLIGSDGVKSVVRRLLFPSVNPSPPAGNCAYRGIIPKSKIEADPIARELVQKPSEYVWIIDKAYIIAYSTVARDMFNVVMSHHRDELVDQVQGADMNVFREAYKYFDPKIKRVMDKVDATQRWPLLVT